MHLLKRMPKNIEIAFVSKIALKRNCGSMCQQIGQVKQISTRPAFGQLSYAGLLFYFIVFILLVPLVFWAKANGQTETRTLDGKSEDHTANTVAQTTNITTIIS